MNPSRIVAVSDFATRVPPLPTDLAADPGPAPRPTGRVEVRGGYLERLPLVTRSPHGLDHRRFRAEGHGAPSASRAMAAHLQRYGAPDILCVWGLGITEAMLDLCAGSIRIYNSLDVDALRIPHEVGRHFDVVLCGSPAQETAVRARHPRAITAVLPVGPEFASDATFRPLGGPKDIDVIVVQRLWTWPQSIARLGALIDQARRRGGAERAS